MENTEQVQKQAPWGVIAVIIIAIVVIVIWQFMSKEPEIVAPALIEVVQPIVEAPVEEPEILPIEEVVTPEEVELPASEIQESEVVNPLPLLDESDSWVQEKLPTLTWRKELLKLIVNDDMIRRFVVFTDNFAQGQLAYEHSPLVKPKNTFNANEVKATAESPSSLQWDETSTRRFSLYVDLLRSIDTDTLIQWYTESKPLIDQAYDELGYPDANFTETLQDAIIRILDMEIPKVELELTRPSVMYKFADDELESLDDSDKLLLRLGRENLLVIKSILLEINEKLSRVED